LGCAGCVEGVIRKDVKTHISGRLLDRVVLQNTQIESLQQELQSISSQFEKIKKSLEQRVTQLESKVSELNGELKSEIKPLKLKQPEGMSKGQPISKQQPVSHVTGTYKPKGAEFTMTDFEEYRKDNDRWYSPHFYTHPNGYKMCLMVFANGIDSIKGSYLSIFASLMKGEFDDQLKWPFRGIIPITLMNQEEDKDHVTHRLKFTSDIPEQCCQRVMTEIRSNDSSIWGCRKFLPLTELQPKYLKNDCIKLQIKKVELF
jgi:TNF receptor-associated factor 4